LNITRKSLGVLTLANTDSSPPPPADTVFYPDWFSHPVIEHAVPDAYARKIISGDQSLTDNFVQAARTLEKKSASAITILCGYSIIYQQAIADAVSIPVITSSLLQLPMISAMIPPHGRIGIVVFDKSQLTDNHFACAGFKKGTVPIAVAGIEGTNTWKNWIADKTTTDYDDLSKVTLDRTQQLLKQHPDITHLLLECTGFPFCSAHIRKVTGLPVFDWSTLCNYTMACI